MRKLLLILAVIALLLNGCGTMGSSNESYLREDVDFAFCAAYSGASFSE